MPSSRSGVCDEVSEAIGGTPLLRLRRASETTGCTILAKAEFMNPGGSVKDRAARAIVLDAESRGVLSRGGLIVEGTAGNTGIGLALVARARGYRTRIVIPESQSQEKKDWLRLCGAEVVEAAAVPFRDPRHYVHVAERMAKDLAATEPAGVLYANQWDNPANRQGHYDTTAPEIWEQTGGRIDAFVSAIGTGGTLAGVGAYLKERRPEVVVALADPLGAAMYHWFRSGELRSEGTSIVEGIGQGRVTGNVEGAPVDVAFQIPDREALELLFELVVEEGLCVGGSSAINVAGAIRLAHDLGPGHTLVTLLCDHGSRYRSKLFDSAFLSAHDLPLPPWERAGASGGGT